MMHHIRPWQLFSRLTSLGQNGLATGVRLEIPTIPARESLTVFSLETLLLIAAARITKASSILEIGTSIGYTSLHLAMNLPAAAITTVDIEKKPAMFEGTEWEGQVHQLIGDTTQISASQKDMVFIDGDHSYKWAKQDTRFAFSCQPKVVAWHDYCRHCPGVIRWLTQLSNSRDLYWVEDSWLVFWFRDGLAI